MVRYFVGLLMTGTKQAGEMSGDFLNALLTPGRGLGGQRVLLNPEV